jgi:hypothetical protein
MDIYCQIDGMPGDCPEQKHKDWCAVLGCRQAGIRGLRAGRKPGDLLQ